MLEITIKLLPVESGTSTNVERAFVVEYYITDIDTGENLAKGRLDDQESDKMIKFATDIVRDAMSGLLTETILIAEGFIVEAINGPAKKR